MVEEVLLYKPNLSTPRSNSGGRHHMVTHLGHAFQSCFTNNTADILINIQLPCLLLNWYCAYRGKIDVINYHLQKPVSNTFVNYGLPLLPSINISAQHRCFTVSHNNLNLPFLCFNHPKPPTLPPIQHVFTLCFPTHCPLSQAHLHPFTFKLCEVSAQAHLHPFTFELCKVLLSRVTLFNFPRRNDSHPPVRFSHIECLCTYNPN